MTGPSTSWVRRHRRAILGSIAGTLIVGCGVGLWTGVERVRWAASRAADT